MIFQPGTAKLGLPWATPCKSTFPGGRAWAKPPRSLRRASASLRNCIFFDHGQGKWGTAGPEGSLPPRSLSRASAGASAGSPSPNQSLAPPKAQLTQTKKEVFDVIKDRSSAARQMDNRVEFRHRITNNLVPVAANECPVSVWLFGVIQRRWIFFISI